MCKLFCPRGTLGFPRDFHFPKYDSFAIVREDISNVLKGKRMNTQAAIEFTPAAVARVKQLIQDDGNPNLKLRVSISGGGCGGFNYNFAFDEIPSNDDVRFDVDGVTFLVDPMSYQYLTGATVDYEEKLEGSRFIVKNPHAKTTCGCGSSFSA